MAHKTLTISEEAYNALARIKSKDESFTKVILRLAQRRSNGNLLEYVRSFPPDNDLADRIEEVLENRGSIRVRAAELFREIDARYKSKRRPTEREILALIRSYRDEKQRA